MTGLHFPQESAPPAARPPYSVYLLLCKGDVLYTGITNDVARRYRQHCAGTGAKFTRIRPPQALLGQAEVGDRSSALKIEYVIKQLPRAKKLAFVQGLAQAKTDSSMHRPAPCP